jgi:gamma-glutamyltranspeptidase / glutathione hydrolase
MTLMLGSPRARGSAWRRRACLAVQAVNAPRLHHQWQPDEIALEDGGFTPEQTRDLETLGHALRFLPDVGSSPVILHDSVSGDWTGAADPRRGGLALGD